MTDLKTFVSSLLTVHGAVVEPVDPDGLELLLPAALQDDLSLSEYSRLTFGSERREAAEQVTLTSEWLSRFGRLLDRHGRYLALTYQPTTSGRRPDAEALVGRHIAFGNATWRFKEAAEANTRYMMVTFKLKAVSDEKREDICHVCVNESCGALADDLIDPFLTYVYNFDGSAHVTPTQRIDDASVENRVIAIIRAHLPSLIQQRFDPFFTAMERRMRRDIDRLHAYYANLRNEAVRQYQDKELKGKDDAELDRERLKISAVEREYPRKIEDLRRKFAIQVEAEPIQALRITMPVYRIQFTALRKRNRRDLSWDWNPLTHRLESNGCEGCHRPIDSYELCDDHLHLLCNRCHSRCSSCQKPFCRACHPDKCVKCGARENIGSDGSQPPQRALG